MSGPMFTGWLDSRVVGVFRFVNLVLGEEPSLEYADVPDVFVRPGRMLSRHDSAMSITFSSLTVRR